MKLSAPVYQLKRRAKILARNAKIPLHQALNQVAGEEGYAGWSLLAARRAERSPSQAMLDQLEHGDLLLLGARPGQGKTLLGLQLLLDAARAGRRAVFFTLEYSEPEARQRIRALDSDSGVGDKLEVVTSDDISADYIIGHLTGAGPGSVAIIDYLQILDQKRSKPALADQLQALRAFARRSGVVLGFISQIDRSFDPSSKLLPDIADIRLPNRIDLTIFSRACFLHNGEVRLQRVA